MEETLGFYWKTANYILPNAMEGAKLLIHKAEKQKNRPPVRPSGRIHYEKKQKIDPIRSKKGQLHSKKFSALKTHPLIESGDLVSPIIFGRI